MVSINVQFAVLGGLVALAGGAISAAAGFLISAGGAAEYAGAFMIVAAVSLGVGGGILAGSGAKVVREIQKEAASCS